MTQKLNSLWLPWPVDWKALFGEDRPLILEIGFGNGRFLAHLAEQYPETNIVGIEVSSRCMREAEALIEKKKLSNVRVIHSTADTALHHLFTPASIAQVYVNFPDPWFKKRHKGRRLMNRKTLDAIVNRLAPQGRFYLATDILAYAEMTAELLSETPQLTNLLPTTWAHSMEGRIVTKYERKAHEEGRACYYFAYERNNEPAPEIYQVEEWDMPHLVFASPLEPEAIQKQFQKLEHQAQETNIAVIHAYHSENTVLFETIVHEPTIEQHIALLLVRKSAEGQNLYTLKVASLGSPRPTPGVHLAVAQLGQWLLGLHPDNNLVVNKVRTQSL